MFLLVLRMSDYVKTQLQLLDEVNAIEMRNHPDKTVIVTSLFATWDETDAETVKQKARSLGYYGGSSTSLNGSFALKFVKPE